MKRTILIAVSFLFMIFTFWNSAQAAGGTDYKTISEIFTYPDGLVRVKFTTSHLDPDGCGNANYAWLPANADKNMYATLLSAFVSGKQVSMFITGCFSQYNVKAANIYRLGVR